LLQATGLAGLPYERVRKAIYRGRISEDDLSALIEVTDCLSELSADDIEKMYPGSVTKLKRRKRTDDYGKDEKFSSALSEMYKFYPRLRSLAKQKLYDQVSTLYQNWPDEMAMVLFCHEKEAIPIEWDPKNKEAQKHMLLALEAGGAIIYVLESQPGSDFDKWDDRFELLIDRVASSAEEAGIEEGNGGFVALLRVPKCSYCQPFVKPTLFSAPRDEDDDLARRAVLALRIPKSIDGKDVAGSMFIPQGDAMAKAMADFVGDNAVFLYRESGPTSGYRWQSYPKMEDVKEPARILRERL
jgi:hypothetical protein